MATSSQSSHCHGSYISKKRWFLTLNESNKEVFVWKENLRLKLKGGESAGAVEAVVSHPSENNAVIVSLFFSMGSEKCHTSIAVTNYRAIHILG